MSSCEVTFEKSPPGITLRPQRNSRFHRQRRENQPKTSTLRASVSKSGPTLMISVSSRTTRKGLTTIATRDSSSGWTTLKRRLTTTAARRAIRTFGTKKHNRHHREHQSETSSSHRNQSRHSPTFHPLQNQVKTKIQQTLS